MTKMAKNYINNNQQILQTNGLLVQ